jgi:hypothetical protein
VVICRKGTGKEVKKTTAQKGGKRAVTKEEKTIEDHRIMTADGTELREVTKCFPL